MTAAQLLQFVGQGLYLLVFAIALGQALRRPRPAAVEIALLFGAIAWIVLVTWLFNALGMEVPRALSILNGTLFMATPYILLRLVDRFLGVPSAISIAAIAGFVASAAMIAAVPAPLPAPFLQSVVGYFVILTLYVTVRFLGATRSAHGITSRRMTAAGLGTLCLAGVILIAGFLPFFPEERDWLQIVSGSLTVGSGLAYYLGFTTPAWLRRAWQEPDLRAFFVNALERSEEPDDPQLVKALENGVATTLGVPTAFVGLWEEERGELILGTTHPLARTPPSLVERLPGIEVREGTVVSAPDAGLAGRCFTSQLPIYSENPGKDAPEFAEAYRAVGARAVIVAPMTVAGTCLGVAGVYSDRPSIFAEDDLELVTLMARYAAAVLHHRRLVERIAVLDAEREVARQKDAFLAAVTHDLKTPITSIRGVAQWVRRRAERPDALNAQAITADMERIESVADRMTGLVNQLLDISRIQMGRPLELAASPTDLVQLCEQVVAQFRGGTSRHQFEILSDREAITGRWDPIRLERVLTNLVENAVKYSPDGGPVKLHLGLEPTADGQLAAVRVEDQGIGIPAEDLPRIFQRFERGHNATGLGIPGTGIGLSYVLEVIDAHGGRVMAESVEGRGSTFTLLLPLSAPRGDGVAEQPAHSGKPT